MTIRKIARMGQPVLQRIATAVSDPTAPEIARLAQDMIDTCGDINGNGIAAPQVYEPLRMFVFRVVAERMPPGAQMKPIPWTVVINPVLTFLSEETKLYAERCLSLPGLYGQALRHTQVKMEAVGLDGRS